MPIFEYECTVCKDRSEVLHRLSQPLEEVFPGGCANGCGQTLVRLVSAPRVRFSGSGYYETDEKPKEKQRNVVTKDDTPAKTETACKTECKTACQATTPSS